MIILPQKIFSLTEYTMQTTGILYQKPMHTISLLRAADEQPKLAGELISKTVENMRNQKAQTPAEPTDISGITGTGKIVNTAA
jgi:hypothetical protein